MAKNRGMRRAQFIPIVAASFLVSQLVGLYVQNIEHLQYAVFLVGISYGATFGLLPVIVIEWFGMGSYSRLLLLEPPELTTPSNSLPPLHSVVCCAAHVSENAGFFFLSPLVMSNVLSMTFGRVFDAHSSYSEHGMRCLEGPRCYSESLYVTTLACFFAFLLACVAVNRDLKYR